MLKKLGFLSEAPDKLRWLDYSGKSTLYTHRHTKTGDFSYPQSLQCWDTEWVLWQRILNPQRRFGLWCFFLRPLCPAQYHGSNEGCIKMRALGSFHGMGCSPLRFECETPTHQDLYTGNLNLTLINKTKCLFTPKNSNTGSFTYEGQSIIYIHTARDGRAITRELIVSHNYRSTISGSLEIVALLLPLKYTYNWEQGPSLDGVWREGKAGGGKVQSLKWTQCGHITR